TPWASERVVPAVALSTWWRGVGPGADRVCARARVDADPPQFGELHFDPCVHVAAGGGEGIVGVLGPEAHGDASCEGTVARKHGVGAGVRFAGTAVVLQ